MDFSLIVKIFLLTKKFSLLTKNPQFLSDFDETLRDDLSHGNIHLPKYEQNRTKIVDFLLMAYFAQFCENRLLIKNFFREVRKRNFIY